METNYNIRAVDQTTLVANCSSLKQSICMCFKLYKSTVWVILTLEKWFLCSYCSLWFLLYFH